MALHGEGTPLPANTARKLVVDGPYRYVRNPMAASGLGQGAAVGLILESWLVVLYAVLGSIVWNCLVRPAEESDLLARFGESYREYTVHVRCWVPKLKAWIPPPGNGGI